MPHFQSKAVKLHYRESGEGVAFVFQHGLGASVSQPFELFKEPSGIRLIGFDARGHGLSVLGPLEDIGLRTSADDLLALLDFLGLKKAVVGGISMGAAIALNFTLRHPHRVSGLVLSRPAWLDGPNPFNVQIFSQIAELMERLGPEAGQNAFQQSEQYGDLLERYPDTAKSLAAQFSNPRPRDTAVNLQRIPRDTPVRSLRDLTAIAVPTLVLANQLDPIHPYDYGNAIAHEIPGAEFHEVVSKSVDLGRHVREVGHYLGSFLSRNFLQSKTLI